ncbi:MAG: alpha/beta hydrolase [Alphaproteobacteria bacterium]
MRRPIKIIIALAIVLYVLPLIAVFIFQRSLLYFPPQTYVSPATLGLGEAQEVSVAGNNGDILTGWWLPPSSDKSYVILFFHGNGSAVYSNHTRFSDLNARGLGVFSVGYSGYPGSGGRLSQDAIVNGARAQYDWVVSQGISPDRILFFGTSLGAGVASQLALQRRPRALIVEAPFNSAVDVGRMSMPVFPVGLLMKDSYRSDQALSDMDMPLVWVHGTADTVIPLSQGQKLYDAYTGPKSHLIIDGGEHLGLWEQGGREFVLGQLSNL